MLTRLVALIAIKMKLFVAETIESNGDYGSFISVRHSDAVEIPSQENMLFGIDIEVAKTCC